MQQEHDAKFLTCAFIWEKEEKTLVTPHFITTDWGDICKNKSDIIQIANKELSSTSGLEIQFVIDMIS